MRGRSALMLRAGRVVVRRATLKTAIDVTARG